MISERQAPETGDLRTSTHRVEACRRVVVQPSMCGHNALLVGHIGDWAWDAVSEASGVDVLGAVSDEGDPVYLSFCYYDIAAAANFHLRTPTFGDELEVVSQVFAEGPQSVVVLQRISPIDLALPRPLTTTEFAQRRYPGAMYVRTFNRWISRTQPGNAGLVPSRPHSWRARDLAPAGETVACRPVYNQARAFGRFSSKATGGAPRRSWTFPYTIDPARDLNGVGLLYFATYFSIADRGLAAAWRSLDRSTTSFLERIATRTQVAFLANADPDTTIDIEVTWTPGAEGERFDIELNDGRTGEPIAVVAIDLQTRTSP